MSTLAGPDGNLSQVVPAWKGGHGWSAAEQPEHLSAIAPCGPSRGKPRRWGGSALNMSYKENVLEGVPADLSNSYLPNHPSWEPVLL